MTGRLYTIGHSTHSLERFIELLKAHRVTAIADVRSRPTSKTNPQFDKDTLLLGLKAHDIAYVFLGRELGGRADDPACYVDGKVNYERVAKTESFRRGLERVREGLQKYNVALMCAEKDPLACHRTILIGRHLYAMGIAIDHILADGILETHQDVVGKLIGELKISGEDFFSDKETKAYEIQGGRIAYEIQTPKHIKSA